MLHTDYNLFQPSRMWLVLCLRFQLGPKSSMLRGKSGSMHGLLRCKNGSKLSKGSETPYDATTNPCPQYLHVVITDQVPGTLQAKQFLCIIALASVFILCPQCMNAACPLSRRWRGDVFITAAENRNTP